MKRKIAVLLVVLLLIGLPITSSALTLNTPIIGPILINPIPSAPTSLQVPFNGVQGANSLFFNWSDTSSNETGFIIERHGINQYSWTEVGRVGANITTFTDIGLSPSTTYVYQVKAYNSTGSSNPSSSIELTTNALLKILTPNGGETINGGSVYNITWDIIGDHGSPIGGDMGISLFYSIDGNLGYPINQTSVAAGAGSYLWTVPKLNSTNVEVSAMFSAGFAKGTIRDTSDSNFAIQYRGLNLTPISPSHLTGSLVSTLTAYLEWDHSAADKVGYVIQRKTGTGTFEMISINKANEYDFTNSTLSPGTTYTYRVIAYNGFGDSTPSNEVIIKTAPLLIIATKPAIITPTSPAIITPTGPAIITPTEPAVDIPGEIIGASPWAEPEIEKAKGFGLTTDKILSNFQANITREEFCEIAVKLYEELSSQTAIPVSPNPFKDTNNSEILKAKRLGIVNGTSATTFSPTSPVTRQEISVMLMNTLKIAKPGLDYTVTGTISFADQKQISSWALSAISYMNSVGIMKGSGNNVMPLGNTSREQGIALVLRSFEEFK